MPNCPNLRAALAGSLFLAALPARAADPDANEIVNSAQKALPEVNEIVNSVQKVITAAGWVRTLEELVFFGAIVGIVSLVISGRLRRARLEHETLRVMVEKGVPIPKDLFDRSPRRNDLRKGLIWIAIGLGLLIIGICNSQTLGHGFSLAAIPTLVGVAFVIAAKMEKSNREPRDP
jgi:Domain of unknown function (DUF6249)